MITRRVAQAFLGVMAVIVLIWTIEIVTANQIARRDFSQNPCWFVPEDNPANMPGLVPGPKGIYVLNPLRLINRRFIGFGLNDPNVHAPHFAVAALDTEGRPALWGWSFRNMDFWPLNAKAQSRGNGPLTDFASEDAIRLHCPSLATPVNAERFEQ